MAGYKRDRRVELKFGPDTGDMAGLEVTLRRMTVEQVLDISELADIPDDAPTQEKKKILSELADRLGEQIVRWNLLDDNDEPIEPSGAALRAEDLGFLLEIVSAYVGAVGGVPAPLAQTSSAGAPSPAVSIPMEVLSPAPVS